MTLVTFHHAINAVRARAARSAPGWLIAMGAVVAVLLVSPALDLPLSNPAYAQTQLQLNEEACSDYKKVDAEMNAVYRQITREYRKDVGFIVALKKAQLAWIRYRDAQLESIFPGDPSQYGSISMTCRCNNLTEITKARTEILNRWVEGVEEGDVCAGSVKTK